MRPFHDLSLFHRQEAQLVSRGRDSSVYQTSRDYFFREWVLKRNGAEGLRLYAAYLCESTLTAAPYFQRRRNQLYCTVEYLLEGEMFFRCGQEAFAAEAGDLVLLHPHGDNDLYYPGGGICRKYGMTLDGDLLSPLLLQLRLDGVRVIPFTERERFERIFRELARLLPEGDGERIGGLVFELLLIFAAAVPEPPLPPPVAKALKTMEKRLAEPLLTSDLAAEAGLSLPTFNKLFAAALRLPPHQYLKRLRLTHAARLLAEEKLSIKEVAAASGYNQPRHFSLEFRRFHGKTPGEFRTEQLSKS